MIEVNNSEQQVLMACVRASLESRQGRFDGAVLARSIDVVEDWQALVQAALDHGLLGMLWYCSTLDKTGAFPADIKRALAAFIDSQRVDNTARADKLLQVLALLADAGIKAAPFKGPLLAESVYGDIGMRSFWDLDFLVPEQQFDRAMSILLKNGFCNRGQPADYVFSQRQLSEFWRYAGQSVLLRESDQLSLEPHVAFAPVTLALDYDYDDLWQRASRRQWRGQQTWHLEIEDQLLMLCLQGAKPYWDSLKILADIAHFMARHPNLDWDKVIERARAVGCLRLLAVAMLLAERLFGILLPAKSAKLAHADSEAVGLCDCLVHQEESFPYAATEVFTFSRYHLDTRERYLDKLKCVWRTAVKPNEAYIQLIRLPDSLFWGYHLVKLGNDAYVFARQQLRRLL